MGPHGRRRDIQVPRNLFIRHVANDEAGNLPLALAESRVRALERLFDLPLDPVDGL